MHGKKKIMAGIVALTLAGFSLSACSSEEAPAPVETGAGGVGLVIDGETIADEALFAAAKGGTVNVVTALSESTQAAMLAKFTEQTGIATSLTRLPSPKLFERVLSEHGAGKLEFDAVVITDSTAAKELADKGALVPFETPFDEQLKKDGAIIDDGAFLSAFYAMYTFAYNTETVTGSDIPKSWQDFASKKFDKQLGMVNPNGSGYNTAMVDMLIQEFGAGYIEKIAALSPVMYDTVAVQGDALARGELKAITISLGTALNLQSQGAPIQVVMPTDGSSGSYTPFGLTPHGVDNPAAQVYANWQMSKAGQEFMSSLGFIPARSDLGAQKVGDLTLPVPGEANFVIYTQKDQAEREESTLATWNSFIHYAG